ncbi:HEAT repeat domain-containing protein [Actinoplanes utahensis]|uniref:PBS lyase n=1 Tax=Actinoplanes utahensis TaxID=1869 RepID=A0A0A6UQ94_ACTUT|nr:HEAT repeat domain-containing protein [Actinoplanes utahensis]KHD77208.1 hypothetical protein MB27_12245 [Actinoplanes utahensis]
MTLDLDGVRRLVVDLDATREWRSRVCEPYVEHALRVEARVAEAGGSDELRMVALLHGGIWLTMKRRRSSLRNLGVPRRVLDLVDILVHDRDKPVGEHARQIREAGLEIVYRAEVADLAAGWQLDRLRVLVELDLTDPARCLGPADVLRRLSVPVDSFDWWYSVAAAGRLRLATAVPHLAGLLRQSAEERTTSWYGAGVLKGALAEIFTGSTRYHYDDVKPDASFTPVLLQLAEDRVPVVRDFALRLLHKASVEIEHVAMLRRALGADAEVAAAAAVVLGRGRIREAVPDLITVVTDHASEAGRAGTDFWRVARLRSVAAYALGNIGDPAAVDALVLVMEQESRLDVRRAAAEALGRIGGPRAIAALLRQDHIEALRVLGRLRVPEAVPGLLRLLQAQPASRVDSCAKALTRIGAREAVGALATVVTTSDDPLDRLAAIRAITRLDPDVALDAVLIAARDPDRRVRRQAAVALARCRSRDPRVIAAMATVLATGPGQRQVLRALTGRPDPRAAPAVFQLLRHTPDPVHRRLAAHALSVITPLTDGMTGRIEAELRKAREPVHHHLAWLLGELGARHAAPALARQLTHRSERIRSGAAAALARMGPPDPTLPRRDTDRVTRRLAVAVSDPSPHVRAKALLALGSRGRTEDLPRLRAGLDDPHPAVRAATAQALRRYGHAVRDGSGTARH